VTGNRIPLFHGVFASLGAAFTGWNALFPVLALLATAGLVASGIDASVRTFFLESFPPPDPSLRFAHLMAGMLWPLVPGLVLLRRGFHARDARLTAGGCAVLQTIIVVGLLTLVLKLLTGRPPPDANGPAGELHLLELTFARGRFMWPSGHASESFSAAAALATFYRKKRWVAALVYPLATAVSVSMVAGSFHWVSDVVAGGLIAFPIGRAIGRRFDLSPDGRDLPS
jgi:membrane-associated phospholipid phosphatase